MQGGQPDPGRGVYVVRRIVAALVVLLLLVLLVPRACQALFPEEESGSRAPETAVTDEDIVAEQADTADDSLEDGEIDARGGTGSPTGGTEAGRSENSEELSAEVVNITEVVANLEAPLLEGSTASDQAVPVPTLPSIDAGDQQQPVQPVAQQEPVQPIAQPAGPPALYEVEPIFFEVEPIFFEEDRLYFGEPVFFEEPFLLEAPILFGNNSRLEEGAGGAMDAAPGGDAPTTTDSGGAVAVSGAAIAIS